MRCGRCQQTAVTAVTDQLDSRNKNNDKIMFVMTKVLSQQKIYVMTNDVFCHDKHMFVMTKHLLRQILVAASANDTLLA